jgi:hypothetical protein
MKGNTALVLKYEGKPCPYCGNAMNRLDRYATRDHMLPKSKGGKGGANILIVCNQCNHHKGPLSLEQFAAKLTVKGDRRAAIVWSLIDRLEEAKKPAEPAKSRTPRKRGVRTVPIPASVEQGEKFLRGTMAHAIKIGEVTEHCTYRRRPASTEPGSDPRPRGRKMTALEFARWLRESAEKKGQPWPLA